MKMLTFSNTSLDSIDTIHAVVDVLKQKQPLSDTPTYVTVDQRAKTEQKLQYLLDLAINQKEYHKDLQEFKTYHIEGSTANLTTAFETLDQILSGISLVGNYSTRIEKQLLGITRNMTALFLQNILQSNQLNTQILPLSYDNISGKVELCDNKIHKNTDIIILYGVDSTNQQLGSLVNTNYLTSLVACQLKAQEVVYYTETQGIYTADPSIVDTAKLITELSYQEAKEISALGTNFIDAKSIEPLVNNKIPLRICSITDTQTKGTLICDTKKTQSETITAVASLQNCTLVSMQGNGLLGKSGIDARIFTALAKHNISVSVISQSVSEQGIGFVIRSNKASEAKKALKAEFAIDIENKNVSELRLQDQVAVLSVIGQDLNSFQKVYEALINNAITPMLFSNSITGKNIGLVISQQQLQKATTIVHGQLFGVAKQINVLLLGHGLVGGTLIDQLLEASSDLLKRKEIQINIIGIANSKKLLLSPTGISENWKELMDTQAEQYDLNTIFEFVKKHHLANLIAIDNTASTAVIEHYIPLIENGFHLVSSNKIANTLSYEYYQELRAVLKNNQKNYLYETNVGAGLPLIDTIKLLHLSGENITRIKGVFSGSLSYLFNTFSVSEEPFEKILREAMDKGYTEPDPREDLCGNDVGRKLLILARELGLINEFKDINIHNLIPEHLQSLNTEDFISSLEDFNPVYNEVKESQQPDHVLRYIGDLHGNLSKDKGILDVKLVSVPSNSALGQVKGSDSIFEIYTESYGDQPIVIQGAGAGAMVTARGVFGDILRLIDKI